MSDNLTVKKLVDAIYAGEIVLPDFQRSFIWGPEDVRELLVSILGDYFIGTFLILELFKDDSPFQLRLVEGVNKINPEAKTQSIVKIILDGQQRTTALFYALFEPDLPLKGRKGAYKFYLDLEKALNEDWDSSIIGINVRDKRRLTEIKEKALVIPFSFLKDPKKITRKFKDHSQFESIFDLVKDFLDRPINVIKLPRDTNLEKIVEIFERINRTGEPLSVFDLLTAKLYKDRIKLRNLLAETQSKYEVLNLVKPEFILKTIVLIRGEEPKRKNILNLKSENFEKDWQIAVGALQEAYERIIDIKNGYGVFNFSRWMPYTTMLIPLAALLNFLKNKKLESPKNYKKIDEWYWISVFLNRYDQAVDTISFSDVKVMKEYLINDSHIPKFLKEFNIKEVDLEVEKQGSAVYRGVINLIVLAGAFDFKTGKPPQFDEEKVQDDHIFPQSIYRVNSVLNRTLITSNSAKGSKIPSKYFKNLIKDYGEKKLIEILKTHIIPSNALNSLLEDNLNRFLAQRKQAMLDTIRRKVER